MRCQTAISLLGSLLDLELSPLRRAGLEIHLVGCPSCHAYWRSYQQTVALARGAYASRSIADEDRSPKISEKPSDSA